MPAGTVMTSLAGREDVPSATPLSSPATHNAVRSKLTKWAMFTVGLVLVTVTADLVPALVNQEGVSLARFFGRGELLMISIGVLVAGSAELLFDRLIKDGATLLHAVMLGCSLLMVVPTAAFYGWAKSNDPAMQTMTKAAIEARGTHWAWWSVGIFCTSLVLSGVCVYLSEKVRRDGTR